MQLVGNITRDGSFVGQNPSSLVAPGGIFNYTLYAEREGPHMMYSAGTTTGGEGDGGSLNAGLFGAINVEPQTAEYYRSQVTRADLLLTTQSRHSPRCLMDIRTSTTTPAIQTGLIVQLCRLRPSRF